MVNEGKGSGPGVRRGIILLVVVLAVAGTFLLRSVDRRTSGTENSAAENREETVSATLPLLLDLGADKCIPCKMMAPILVELEADLEGQLEVTFLDVWKNPDQSQKYDIKLIPTQIFFGPDGVELFRHEGFFGRDDILAKWRELGYEFQLPTAVEG